MKANLLAIAANSFMTDMDRDLSGMTAGNTDSAHLIAVLHPVFDLASLETPSLLASQVRSLEILKKNKAMVVRKDANDTKVIGFRK